MVSQGTQMFVQPQFVPEEGQLLQVWLPGESLRAPVIRIFNNSIVFVQLDSHPLNPGHSHNYRHKDVIPVQRVQHELGERWEAMDERLLAAPPEPDREPPPPEVAAEVVGGQPGSAQGRKRVTASKAIISRRQRG